MLNTVSIDCLEVKNIFILRSFIMKKIGIIFLLLMLFANQSVFAIGPDKEKINKEGEGFSTALNVIKIVFNQEFFDHYLDQEFVQEARSRFNKRVSLLAKEDIKIVASIFVKILGYIQERNTKGLVDLIGEDLDTSKWSTEDKIESLISDLNADLYGAKDFLNSDVVLVKYLGRAQIKLHLMAIAILNNFLITNDEVNPLVISEVGKILALICLEPELQQKALFEDFAKEWSSDVSEIRLNRFNLAIKDLEPLYKIIFNKEFLLDDFSEKLSEFGIELKEDLMQID